MYRSTYSSLSLFSLLALALTGAIARADDAGSDAATAADAGADAGPPVDCNTLPSPVYGDGGSAQSPLLGRLAAKLRTANPPVSLVYAAPGACNAIYALQDLVAGTGTNGKINGTASYWDPDGTQKTCNLPITGATVQFGVMGNSPLDCANVASIPDAIGDVLGPVETATFIVPVASNEQSFSAAAAYFVFGFGQAGQAAPWTNEAEIIRRDQNSFLTAILSQALKVPLSKLTVYGVDAKTNGNTVTLVSGATDPQASIGVVSGEIADANRSKVKTLAYQHFGQSCGYWPDSTPTSFDKRNIRTGQYELWAPIHFLQQVDPVTRAPTDAAAAKIIGYLSSTVAPPTGIDVLNLEIKSGTVPKCAMEVWRDVDLGDTYSYAAPEPCGCYFDSVATGSTSCQACGGGDGGSDASAGSCPATAPHCRFGFCEVN